MERGKFASQLEQAIAQQLGHPGKGRTRTLAAGRASVAPSHSAGDKGLLEAIEKREALSRKIYEEALQQDLPDNLPEVIARQSETVKAVHDYLKSMRQRMLREAA